MNPNLPAAELQGTGRGNTRSPFKGYEHSLFNALRVLVLMLAAGGLLLPGCSKSTKPRPVKYNIYLGASMYDPVIVDSFWGWIYAYDSDSLNLVDSINLIKIDPTRRSFFADELAVSPEGRWLYVLAGSRYSEPSTLWKIDARTKQAVWSRPGWDDSKWLPIRLLQNGTLLLVGDTVLHAEDGSVAWILPHSLRSLWGPRSGTKVAAIVRSGPNTESGGSVVEVIDVLTGDVSGSYTGHLASGVRFDEMPTARLHPDGKRVLAVGLYGTLYNCWFVVGDLETGQTLFEYQLDYPFGEIAISDDGLLAALTDPGGSAYSEYGRAYVVDLQTMTVTIPTPPVELLHKNWAAQICFLPGDRRVATAPQSYWYSHGPLSTIEVTKPQFEKSVWLPQGSMFTGGLGVGPRP